MEQNRTHPNSNLPALRAVRRALKGKIARRYETAALLRSEAADLQRMLSMVEADIREQGGRIRG